MHHPSLRGRCPRRALIAWRLDPVVARRLVPAPLRPKLLQGAAIGAVDCLRLERLRPRLMPPALGLSMELCAHIIAVEWVADGVRRDGLYVLRRDVEVRGLGRAAGLLLPGNPQPAHIRVQPEVAGLQLACHSLDGRSQIDVGGQVSEAWIQSTLFGDAAHMLRVLGNRSGGFLAFDEAGHGSLVELDTKPERAEVLALQRAHSSLFEGELVPKGAAIPDAALLLRDLVCVWRSQGRVLRAERPSPVAGTNPEGLREPSPA
ncbi:MAG: hypothetical protein H6830_09210 [Planctomycetes bacterium]|nr:hypothetical protein [Planctomycetota bacterium]MCB9909901.1 hypothetical protein [Planctomycetota bacterium]MCB9912962.1 hypothetical protein [Planctomycetota bacterium]